MDFASLKPAAELARLRQPPFPGESAEYSMAREELLKAMEILTEREQMILKLRFGFDDGRPRTLEEVGKVYNVTRERIRQIEEKALRKLRHPTMTKTVGTANTRRKR